MNYIFYKLNKEIEKVHLCLMQEKQKLSLTKVE